MIDILNVFLNFSFQGFPPYPLSHSRYLDDVFSSCIVLSQSTWDPVILGEMENIRLASKLQYLVPTIQISNWGQWLQLIVLILWFNLSLQISESLMVNYEVFSFADKSILEFLKTVFPTGPCSDKSLKNKLQSWGGYFNISIIVNNRVSKATFIFCQKGKSINVY